MTTRKGELFAPGATIGDDGRYQIVEPIAIGGMACVYRAHDVAVGTDCAVKAVALPDAEDLTPILTRFEHEAKILARLNHPGVVGIRDYFREGSHAFLVMEFVVGSNLFDLYRDPFETAEMAPECSISPISEELLVDYGLMLGETLARLHRSVPPIIYRDLKPHNIIKRASDGQLILLDFGIARSVFGETMVETVALGTPGYAAPEQYDPSLPFDVRTDIYSLGVVLLELATGYNPRRASSYTNVPLARDVRPSLSPSLARILDRCCQTDPNCRYQSARDLCEALNDWAPSARGLSATVHVALHPSWSLDMGEPVTARPLADGSGILYADNGGMICRIDSRTGRPQWLYREPGHTTMATLVHTWLSTIGREKLFAYSFPMDSGGQGVAVLDASSGAAVWRSFEAPGNSCIPVFTGGGNLIVATSCPDRMQCIPLNDSQASWAAELAATPLSLSIIAPLDGRPELIVSTDREGGVCARRTDDGVVVWHVVVGYAALVAPILFASERIFVGGGRGDGSYAGLDVRTGELVWHISLGVEAVGAPVVTEAGVLIIPTRNSGLIGLNSTSGEVVWHDIGYQLPLTGIALMRGGHAVAVTEYGSGGRLMVLDVMSEPELIWESAIEPKGAIAPPLATNEFLVVAGADGAVTAWAVI